MDLENTVKESLATRQCNNHYLQMKTNGCNLVYKCDNCTYRFEIPADIVTNLVFIGGLQFARLKKEIAAKEAGILRYLEINGKLVRNPEYPL